MTQPAPMVSPPFLMGAAAETTGFFVLLSS
jgi:hypothetical protein